MLEMTTSGIARKAHQKALAALICYERFIQENTDRLNKLGDSVKENFSYAFTDILEIQFPSVAGKRAFL